MPGDDRCARRVRSAAEDRPGNRPYNRTQGKQKLARDFFAHGAYDPRARTRLAPRVTGHYVGTTPEILQWTACKWGINQRIVRAQATVESNRNQAMLGDWTGTARFCAPGHGLGQDGRPGRCPESFGVLQVKYRFFRSAFPSAIRSTAYNTDTAYVVWRACYEGYEWWLRDNAPAGHPYRAGDQWGCIGRWYSGAWYSPAAKRYIACVQAVLRGRQCSAGQRSTVS